jgi:hypothetical protein
VEDVFICKLNNSGNLVWVKALSGPDGEFGNDIDDHDDINIRDIAVSHVTIVNAISSQVESINELFIKSEESLLLDNVTSIFNANPNNNNFICLSVNGSIDGSFPNLESKSNKDVIIIQGSSESDMNFDGNSVSDNDIDIKSNGGVVMIKLVNPNPDTNVFMEDFNFNIDTKDTKSTALFMTQGNTQQNDGLFDIQECNFESEESVNFNNTSSLKATFNNFKYIDFINNRAEAMEDLNSYLIEFIDNEAPINYSMIDLSFHSTVSQFYIPGTITESIKLEVNDRFVYYINAENNNIIITLPSGGSEVEGKMLIFKRIDNSNKRVTIITEEGLIENKKRLRFPDNSIKCNKEDNKYPAVTLHFHERNWWILSSFNS